MSDHPKDCPWHFDYHACNCGEFDIPKKTHAPRDCVIYQEGGNFCEECSTKWYECVKCDAGYEEQKCTCKNNL